MFHAQKLRHNVEDKKGVERELGGITGQRLAPFEGHFELLKQIDGHFLRQKSLSSE